MWPNIAYETACSPSINNNIIWDTKSNGSYTFNTHPFDAKYPVYTALPYASIAYCWLTTIAPPIQLTDSASSEWIEEMTKASI